jgi:hypothetical protein
LAGGKNQPRPCAEPSWQEGAGSLLLLATAGQTGLLAALEEALPTGKQVPARLAHGRPATRRCSILTLLFLGVVGLRRTCELKRYGGDALGLLTGRVRAYGFWQVERFLSQLARAGGEETFTDALAAWTCQLWSVQRSERDCPPPAFYVDGHRKPVYSDHLLPRGLIGRTGKVLGGRTLLLLHDTQGHPHLATTHRGDFHLTKGVCQFLARYEQATGGHPVARLIIDREGMAAECLHQLAQEGRTVVTILKSNQYAGLASFTDVGTFVPLCRDRDGAVTREVACARFALCLPEHPGQTLELAVALIRDLRSKVQVGGDPAEKQADGRWDADLEGVSGYWWQSDWVATPAPALPTEPTLIPIVTTASSVDAVELAQVYTHRWPAQENSIRDFLLSLGLDTNHGFAKVQVENSEGAKIRGALERKRAKARRRADGARERMAQAQERSRKASQQAKVQQARLARLNAARQQLAEQQERPDLNQLDRMVAARGRALTALANCQQSKQRAEHTYRTAWDACEQACCQQRFLLRELEDLKEKERVMYELEHAKDQVMTVLKLALANLVMWTRDTYFPAAYAQATWHRLAPFFRLPGWVVWGTETVEVELRPFNDRRLNRDLEAICTQVNAQEPRLPDGRRLRFKMRAPGTRGESFAVLMRMPP